jgi:hypothetical protein
MRQLDDVRISAPLASDHQRRPMTSAAVGLKQLPGHGFRPAGFVGRTDLNDIHMEQDTGYTVNPVMISHSFAAQTTTRAGYTIRVPKTSECIHSGRPARLY